ncbi:hypothetical protein MKQ68_05220 [Chitinophaga horti]|uniref:LPXTG cell wall anchor domain-containing protein n=1 Tax=Chitinophaga horti TaxID=2920382 RepID=A0ABY6J495_9BACT|nr:hypothetical protein [Chitinophaga horti]UYQ94490.1 hypothetical protein MKQ68_05220 [Chitinophaga horti]
MNWPLILTVAIAAIALVIFLARRNRQDKEEILPPEVTDDPVLKTKRDQQAREDSI